MVSSNPFALVVDDEPAIAALVARELRRAQYDVLLAHSFASAVEVLALEPRLTAVVSDFDLGPGPDGIDLLSRARLMAPTATRLLVTGSSLDAARLRAAMRDNVAQHVLAKPWTRGDIARVLAYESTFRPANTDGIDTVNLRGAQS